MNKLKETKQKSKQTIIALVIIGVAVYLGFTPLFEKIQGGVAGAVIGASFGAIFVIVLTMYLLNQQTEIEQESKKSERIFEEKVKLYYAIYDDIESMLENSAISKEDELKKLPFIMARLITIGSDEVINSFGEIYKAINKIYENKPDEDNVVIDPNQEKDLIIYLTNFAKTCRLDLGVSDKEVSSEIMESSLESIKASTDISAGRNKPLAKKDMLTQARATCGGSDYTIIRYKDSSIRIIKDGEDNPVKNTRAIMREINDEYDLGFIGHTWNGQKVNTRSQGKRMIDLLNSIREGKKEVKEVKFPLKMYHPDTGESVDIKTEEEHDKYTAKGWVHEKPTN